MLSMTAASGWLVVATNTATQYGSLGLLNVTAKAKKQLHFFTLVLVVQNVGHISLARCSHQQLLEHPLEPWASRRKPRHAQSAEVTGPIRAMLP